MDILFRMLPSFNEWCLLVLFAIDFIWLILSWVSELEQNFNIVCYPLSWISAVSTWFVRMQWGLVVACGVLHEFIWPLVCSRLWSLCPVSSISFFKDRLPTMVNQNARDVCCWTSFQWFHIVCNPLVPASWRHYSDVIISTIASQITSLTIVYSTVYSGTDQRKNQSSASLAFV